MVEKDVEMFLEACELKGLSMKTIGSYEQTLRLFMQHLYKIGIERTENVTHLTIQGYIQEIRRRGKYTAVTNQDARNYPENRPDYGKQVSDVTINNYLRNLRVFFNWCVDEDILRKSPIKRGDFTKTEHKPLEFISDDDFKRLLRALDISKFSEYRDFVIIQLLMDTGMRISECLLIQVNDINLAKRFIWLPAKTRKENGADRYSFRRRWQGRSGSGANTKTATVTATFYFVQTRGNRCKQIILKPTSESTLRELV